MSPLTDMPMNYAPPRTIGQLRLALVCCVLLAAGVAGIQARDASAGTWAAESCSLPGGKSAPIEGWQSEADNGGPYTGANDSCPTGGLEAIDSAQWRLSRSPWKFLVAAGVMVTRWRA